MRPCPVPLRQEVPFEDAVFPRPCPRKAIDAARPAMDQAFEWAAGGEQAIQGVLDEFGVSQIAPAADQDFSTSPPRPIPHENLFCYDPNLTDSCDTLPHPHFTRLSALGRRASGANPGQPRAPNSERGIGCRDRKRRPERALLGSKQSCVTAAEGIALADSYSYSAKRAPAMASGAAANFGAIRPAKPLRDVRAPRALFTSRRTPSPSTCHAPAPCRPWPAPWSRSRRSGGPWRRREPPRGSDPYPW